MTHRALLLSPESPYPLRGGGALRTASLLHLLARNYAVDLITFRQPGDADPRASLPAGLMRGVEVIELPFHGRGATARAARNTRRLLRRVPPLMDRFAGFQNQVRAFVAEQHYDLAVIEHFWCAPYVEQIAPVAGRIILDLHNIESVWHARCAQAHDGVHRAIHHMFADICRKMEHRWLPRFDDLMVASSEDARLLRQMSPEWNITVYPNSIPFVEAPHRQEQDVIAFSGNLEYGPNISAVRYFNKAIWPELRDKWPELRWRIIGKNPGAVANIVAGDDRISLSGPVENAIAELACSKVAIVPILAGSGTRVKIIEAWAAGVPVVSTTLGAEGLHARSGEHLLLADTAAGFARAVSELCEDAALRQRIGRAGRYLFECEFNWQAAWKSLHFLYPATMGRSDALRD